MPTIQELQTQAKNLSPEVRQKLIQAIQAELARRGEGGEGGQRPTFGTGFTGQTQGGGFLPRLGQAARATVGAIPSVFGVKTGQEKKEEPSFFEKELFKAQVKKAFTEPEKRKVTKLGVLKRGGKLDVIETDVDRVLKEVVEKSEEELTPSDLINLYRILSVEPTGEKTGGFLGIGGTREFTSEQKILRQKAQEILDRSGATEEELAEGAEAEGEEQDEFGFTIGEEKEIKGKRYKYIGNNQWQEQS